MGWGWGHSFFKDPSVAIERFAHSKRPMITQVNIVVQARLRVSGVKAPISLDILHSGHAGWHLQQFNLIF